MMVLVPCAAVVRGRGPGAAADRLAAVPPLRPITEQGSAGHPFTFDLLPCALEVVDGDEGGQDLRLALTSSSTAIDRASPVYGGESRDPRSVEALTTAICSSPTEPAAWWRR